MLLHPAGPFALAAALRFLDSFAPAGAAAQGTAHEGAHVIDGRAALVRVREVAPGRLEVTPDGAAPLVRRMFSLDWDGDSFDRVGDPVVRGLRERFPGLRPVLFPTPWEALCWSVIGQRISIGQAARLKDRLRDALGPEAGGRRAFPPPEALLRRGVPDTVRLPDVKADRLMALAERGAAGELDADRLLAMAPEEARVWLERSPGIGPWSSAFVAIRAVGFPDLLPVGERRLAASVQRHYGLPAPPADAELAAHAERWSPFRAWAAFLLRVAAGTEAPRAARAPRPARGM